MCGPDDNVLQLTPPMCFTMSNARTLVSALDTVLRRLSRGRASSHGEHSPALWRPEELVDGPELNPRRERPRQQQAKRRRLYEEVD